MWKSISLSDQEYKKFINTLEDFKSDISKLILLQQSGHVPLIVVCRQESMYVLSVAPDTLEVLSEIDSRFEDFVEESESTTVYMEDIDAQDLIFGHKETFRKYYLKKGLLQEA